MLAAAMVGDALKKLATMHEIEILRMRTRFSARVSGHDSVEHSATEQLATFRQGDHELWTAKAEPLARFSTDLGIVRWWWHGTLGQNRSRLDSIVAEGQAYGVEELTRSAADVGSLDACDAICALGAHLAGADGLLRLADGEDWSFYALYEAPGKRITIRMPRVSTPPPPPASHAAQSLPPPPVAPVAPAGPPAEPPKELVSPVAVELMSTVQADVPGGFQQALLTVVIDAKGGKARVFVHVAAIDPQGDLRSIDPSQRLFDAVVAMITEQRRRGGADVRKLHVRLRPTERGASVDVTVA
jgi:hypothetical protein